MGVPGVANVSIWGLRDQQLQVQVDPATLRDRKVTLNQVINDGRQRAGSLPAHLPRSLNAREPAASSRRHSSGFRSGICWRRSPTPDELAKVPIEGTSGALKLGDVADIKVDHQPLIRDAVVNGKPGLILVVEKFPGVSTTQVTRDVQQALETLRPGLSGIETDTSWFAAGRLCRSGQVQPSGSRWPSVPDCCCWPSQQCRFHWRAALVSVITVPLSVITAALIVDSARLRVERPRDRWSRRRGRHRGG